MSSFPTSESVAGVPEGFARSWGLPRGALVACYLALGAIALYPIFSVTVPPLVDYPNHLARMHILGHAAAIPALQRNYVANGTLHPNMAMELVVPLLAQFMSIYMAGKVFIAMTMLSMLAGTMALRKSLYGEVGVWPAVTFLLLYNHILFWGFVDYLFTAALALSAFSAWIAGRHWHPLLRASLFSAVALALFIGHLFALFVYGLLVLGYELWRARGRRPLSRDSVAAWAVSGIQFAAPAALFMYWIAATGTGDPSRTVYGTLDMRFIALISPVLFGMPWIDIPTAIFLAVLFVLCRRNRYVGFAPEMKLPVLLLVGAALAMPQYLSDVWGTHFRLPAILGCVLVAGVRLAPEAGRFALCVAGAAAAFFMVRVAVISHGWADFDRKFLEFRQAAAAIEPGARIFLVEDEADLPPGRIPVYGMQFWYLPALAVIERSAFLPTLFTGHVGVDATADLRHLETPSGLPLSRDMLREFADPKTSPMPLGFHVSRYMWNYWTGWPLHYDYVVSIRFANESNPDPAHLQPVVRGSFFDIYRVLNPTREQ